MLTLNKKQYTSTIRKVFFGDKFIGGEDSLPFMHNEAENEFKPLIAMEILMHIPANYSVVLKKSWGECIYNPLEWVKKASELSPDALLIRFNIKDCENVDKEIEQSEILLKEISETTELPLIILGANDLEIDNKLLPRLAKACTINCTIGLIDEDNCKEIIPQIKEFGHNLIARTPIDINLAKELNIIISDMDYDPNKIIIDPNMGSLGYGLDYAISVMERIKLAGLEGDNMLNMPMVAFAGEEAWKSKESKSTSFSEEWGELDTRAILWECITATSVITAGANLVILYHPQSIDYIRNFIKKA